MARNVAIGIQQFDELIEKKCFYVDKTNFIKEWWESNDSVTLINRPRRFGKTLNMSMGFDIVAPADDAESIAKEYSNASIVGRVEEGSGVLFEPENILYEHY